MNMLLFYSSSALYLKVSISIFSWTRYFKNRTVFTDLQKKICPRFIAIATSWGRFMREHWWHQKDRRTWFIAPLPKTGVWCKPWVPQRYALTESGAVNISWKFKCKSWSGESLNRGASELIGLLGCEGSWNQTSPVNINKFKKKEELLATREKSSLH